MVSPKGGTVREDQELAFRSFVAGRSHALQRTAYLLAGDRHLAEDLLQTALTKTYLAWPRIKDPNAVEAYTRRVLVTTSTSWWRRKSAAEHPTEDVPEASIADSASDYGERDAMWRELRRLPARQRAVMVLRYYEDRSEAEIADLLGCSTGTVKAHASRAMAALKVRLEPTNGISAGGAR
jgi:RNA polymerase sigma-70 factor (sigma-E family)